MVSLRAHIRHIGSHISLRGKQSDRPTPDTLLCAPVQPTDASAEQPASVRKRGKTTDKSVINFSDLLWLNCRDEEI